MRLDRSKLLSLATWLCLVTGVEAQDAPTEDAAEAESAIDAAEPQSGSSRAGGLGPEDLRVGHWAQVKGRPDGFNRLRISEVEVREPGRYEELVGTVADDQTSWERFELLGHPVWVTEETDKTRLPGSRPGGFRIKVEGRYKGPRKFDAREIGPRGAGRDSVEGRIDAIDRVEGGYELRIMTNVVFVPEDLVLENASLGGFALSPPRGRQLNEIQRDDEDDFRETLRLGKYLRMGAQFEWESTREDNYNLDDPDPEDRVDHDLLGRLRFIWEPRATFFGLAEFSYLRRWRDDEDDGRDVMDDLRVGEAFGYWRDVFKSGFDLQVGRQDFDERREWVYDQNLDGVRLIYSRPGLRGQLSVTTTVHGSDRDEDTTNIIGYLSNNDWDRHLAAWFVDRRDSSSADNSPIHFGVRAMGDWLPQNDSWAEFAIRRGFEDDTDLGGYGFDLGTSWSPPVADPLYFTVGYAHGSGDRDPNDGEDENYRQTGFQDNNGRYGGVTSFRYYGEVMDPELSNLGIFTLGVGGRIGKRSSLDLVYHRYKQDVAQALLVNSDIDQRPNGLDDDLGWELDLVLGVRSFDNWQIELVVGYFEPGPAFDDRDSAYLVNLQVRYRL